MTQTLPARSGARVNLRYTVNDGSVTSLSEIGATRPTPAPTAHPARTPWRATANLTGAAVFVASVLFVVPGFAKPPAPGSEDAEILGPYAEWVQTQHLADGRWCCSVSDGRTVETKMSGDHWSIHITPEKFPGSHDHWVDVPPERVLRVPNPTGFPIAWVMNDILYCFAPPSGS